jgi:hypothetical protein
VAGADRPAGSGKSAGGHGVAQLSDHGLVGGILQSDTRIFNGWGNMLLEGAKLTLIAANSAAAIQQGLTRPLGIPIERSVEPPWYFASNTGGCGYTVEPRVTRPPKN